MVKGMAEVMTGRGAAKLGAAVERYLRIEEFAVYVVEQKAGDSMRLLAPAPGRLAGGDLGHPRPLDAGGAVAMTVAGRHWRAPWPSPSSSRTSS